MVKRDVVGELATAQFGWGRGKVTPAMRRAAKAVLFPLLYGVAGQAVVAARTARTEGPDREMSELWDRFVESMMDGAWRAGAQDWKPASRRARSWSCHEA